MSAMVIFLGGGGVVETIQGVTNVRGQMLYIRIYMRG